MSDRQLYVLPDPEAVAEAMADEFIRRATGAKAAGGSFTVALSGGRTPRALYPALARKAPPVLWPAVRFFFGDERTVPPDHPESNFGAAQAGLFSKVGVRPEQVFRMRGEDPDPDRAAADYEAAFRAHFHCTGEEVPRLDLALLGLGENGHTASLFPGSDALSERRRLAVAPWIAEIGARRITLTLPVFERARCVAFLVTGIEKAAVVKEVLEGPRAGSELPAQMVRPLAGELLWYLDRSAGSLLELRA